MVTPTPFRAGVALAILALIVMVLAPISAQQAGQRGTVAYVNATNATVTVGRFGGTIYLTNATGNHTVTVGNASTLAPGARLRIVEVCGKIGSTGNWTISSVSNINGGANYSVNNVTYQGVELEAFALNSTATSAANFRATALAKACYNP